MWSTQFQSLLGDDYANYEEYKGSYDADTSTFTFTQGVSFSMGFQEEYLDTPLSFTAAEWLSTMVEVWDAGTDYVSTFVRNLGVWSRDTNQWYDISSNALTDPTSTAAGQGVRTESNKWVSPTGLGSGFNLNCIENCLSAAKVQTTFVAAMAMIQSGDYSSYATSPYLAVGPYIDEDTSSTTVQSYFNEGQVAAQFHTGTLDNDGFILNSSGSVTPSAAITDYMNGDENMPNYMAVHGDIMIRAMAPGRM